MSCLAVQGTHERADGGGADMDKSRFGRKFCVRGIGWECDGVGAQGGVQSAKHLSPD